MRLSFLTGAAWLIGFATFALSTPVQAQPFSVIQTGAVWKYLDDGSDQGTAWRETDFDDTSWSAGRAELGYGEGDEATVINRGPIPNERYVTAYFRKELDLPDVRTIGSLTLRVLGDDGFVAYLNGYEIFRHNMPAGNIGFETFSSTPLNTADERMFVQYATWPGYLQTNRNVLAIEVHQASRASDDCSFDCELIANRPLAPPEITLVSPISGSIHEEGTIILRAEVSDSDGHVYLVRFYNGAELLGEDYTQPFEWAWKNVGRGRYGVKAQAFDNSGRRSLSETAQIQVGAELPDTVTRGPYLQMASPTNITIRWRTDWFTSSAVRFGPELWNLNREVITDLEDPTTEHEVRLTGLLPDTKYYYTVGTAEETLRWGLDYFFITPPVVAQPTRIWVIGDAGTTNFNQRFVRDVFDDFRGSDYTDVWLMLGDNAYEEGTDDQYQAAVFDMYPNLLRQTVLWPTLGNHDNPELSPVAKVPYYAMFTLPTQGEAGGMASGTEKYYSFDHGNIHFVCLDSHTSDRTPGSPMLTWLEHDLAAAGQDWIIAYWHHPPYSFGSHNSDHELELIQMRQFALPILERFGVDLVLSGHSHNYERSYLLQGHYGFSASLQASMILDGSSGAPYLKPAGGLGARQGTVYTVCGCSGEGTTRPWTPHPAMHASLTGYGSVVIDVNDLELYARFFSGFDTVSDEYRIVKTPATNGVTPTLNVERTLQGMALTWPTSLPSFHPEATSTFDDEDTHWLPLSNQTTLMGRQHRLWLETNAPQQFFRLRRSP